MNKAILVKYFLLISFVIYLSGCSGVKEVSSDITQEKIINSLSPEQRKKIALENFIEGNIFYQQGNFSSALKKFEAALQYDTSAGLLFTYAKTAFRNNRLNVALEASKKSLELDSTNAEYYDLLSEIYNVGRQRDSAIFVLEKATERFPSNQNFLYKLAGYYQSDRPVKAIEIYEKIIGLIGPEWNVLFRLVELNNRLNNTEGVVNALKQLLELDPSNVLLKKSLIENLYTLNRIEEAIQLIDDLIELYPDDSDLRMKKAQALLSNNRWGDAYSSLEYVINNKNINFDDKLQIAYLFFEKSISDSSLRPITKKIFDKLDNDTTYWAIKIVKGALAMEEGDDKTAINNFEYVIENANWNVDAWIRLGALYFDNKKYEEAEKVLTEAIKYFPDNYAVNFILGISLAQQGKNLFAETYLKKAVELNSNDVNTLSAYAYTLNQLKKDDEAIKYLRQALSVQPDDVNVIGTLALIYNSRREFSISDSLYEKALELKPDDPIINNNYAYSLSTRGEQLERALKMVNFALEKDSLNTAYLDTKGWILYKLGDYAEAHKFISRAIELGTESAVIVDHLGDVEFKLGNFDKALKLWRRALELDPTKKEIEEKLNKGEF